MGTETITEGITFLLPINVPGALLAMGYLHAGMSGGEVGISGLEIKGVMEVEVSVIKSPLYPLPLAVTTDCCTPSPPAPIWTKPPKPPP
ncbi:MULTISPECIES: acetamidase/formamidase family protein [unclassified Eikenella]|uniref:acetamidase/formamidase family protein n=1 Tax=unclassified Eikenella TaxID=2639367 RepID=UPI000AF979AE|nr:MULTISPECIES: acetamidase/formamidase family protein [unclassified Eikenella]